MSNHNCFFKIKYYFCSRKSSSFKIDFNNSTAKIEKIYINL